MSRFWIVHEGYHKSWNKTLLKCCCFGLGIQSSTLAFWMPSIPKRFWIREYYTDIFLTPFSMPVVNHVISWGDSCGAFPLDCKVLSVFIIQTYTFTMGRGKCLGFPLHFWSCCPAVCGEWWFWRWRALLPDLQGLNLCGEAPQMAEEPKDRLVPLHKEEGNKTRNSVGGARALCPWQVYMDR